MKNVTIIQDNKFVLTIQPYVQSESYIFRCACISSPRLITQSVSQSVTHKDGFLEAIASLEVSPSLTQSLSQSGFCQTYKVVTILANKYISAISQPYLSLSQPYFSHILAKSQPYLNHISTISQPYLSHKSPIPQP